jgi:hypothetical protein
MKGEMKGKTSRTGVSVATIVAALLLATPILLFIAAVPIPVMAAPTITSDPTSGFVFTEVTLEGIGWAPLATVKIYFNSTAAGIFEFIKDVTTNATGGFKTTALVPAVPPGGYTWYAFIPATTLTAKTLFTVEAGIGVSPTSGPLNTTVTIAGSASEWLGGKVVSIVFDKNDNGVLDPGEILANVTATASGVITATVRIPDLPVPLTDDVTRFFYANKTTPPDSDLTDTTKYYRSPSFTVKAGTLTILPTSGPVNSVVSVAGNFFRANSKVDIQLWQSGALKAVLATNVPTNSTGGFIRTVTIPCTTPGGYNINATDGVNKLTSPPTFTVSTPFLLSLPTKKVGESITVEGQHFAISSSVTIFFSINRDGVFELISVGTFPTNTTGGFKVTVTVPDVPFDTAASDLVKVNATDTCNFAITDFDVIPSITLSPIRGKPGDTVTVVGRGFRNATTVTITFGTAGTVATATTDNYGRFTATFTVPTVPDGTHTVSASDPSGATASATFQVIPEEFASILDAIQDIENKLDIIGPKVDSLVTSIGTINSKVDAIILRLGSFVGTDTVASLLYDVKAAVDGVSAKLGTFTGTDTVASLLYAIEARLDDTSRWVSDADLSSAVSTITSAINDVSAKLGTFTGTDTVASLLYDVKAAVDGVSAKLGTFTGTDTVASLLYAIEARLDDTSRWVSDADLSSAVSTITSAINDVSAKLGTFTGTDTVASLLYQIRAAVTALDLTPVRAGDVVSSKAGTNIAVTSASPYVIGGFPANKAFRGTLTIEIDTTLGSGVFLAVEVWDGDSWARVWRSPLNAPAGTAVSIDIAGLTDGTGNAVRIVTNAATPRQFDYVFVYHIDLG